jgi:prepilin-type processing-associated H-X9-DG protein
MKHPALGILISAAIVFAPGRSIAQDATFADVLSGNVAPTTLKISELSSDFKPLQVRSMGDTPVGAMSSFSNLMLMAGSGGGKGMDKLMPQMFQLGGLSDARWTKGQVTHLAGHEFLITYRLNTGIDPSGGSEPKWAADLTLDLIRTDTITSIAPVAGMTPDSLRKALNAAGATLDATPIHLASAGGDDAIMAAILFPVFAQARTAAKETVTLSNAKQIGLAAIIYANDYDDVFPYVQSTAKFEELTMPYTRSKDIWKTENPNGGGFRFAMNLAGVSTTSIDSPAEAPLIYEANAWPDGRRVVAFADGHAKRVSQEEWAKIEPLLHRKYARTAKSPIKEGV